MIDFDFKHPNYDAVFKKRAERIAKLRAEPELVQPLKEHYKNNPTDFITDWGVTFDPRNADIGLPTTVPFILFQKQEEFINWLRDRWLARQDGLAEKSRDMGVSWLCVAFAVWMWTFHPGSVVGFGSRKEEYVDKIGDPKSLFWKARAFIQFLPKEFRPTGYSEKANAPYMRIINPENGATIVGEAGDNIGRGNRTSIYFKDESAFYEHPEAIDAALSQTSNCKIDVSTPNGNGNPFYRKRHGGKIPVFTFHWTDDPRKDKTWYDKQKETLDPLIVAQEIDIDYESSVSNAWIPSELVTKAQMNGPADVEPLGQWVIGVDAAHEGNDESIIHKRRGRLNLKQTIKVKMDGPELAACVTQECLDLESAGGIVGAIIIELDGPGVSCYDHLKMGKYGTRTIGVHTGARRSDNRNYNLRALLWRRALDYLKDEPVSLDNDPEFKSQICSMLYGYKDGLLLIQNKKEYKKKYGRSPDRADAFVLSHMDFEPWEEPKEDTSDQYYHRFASSSWMS